MTRVPDESTILSFRRLIDAQNLSVQLMALIGAALESKGLLLKTGRPFTQAKHKVQHLQRDAGKGYKPRYQGNSEQ